MRLSSKKTKHSVIKLLALVILASIFITSCSPENPSLNEQSPLATQTAVINPTQQSTDFKTAFGIAITATSLCSDGVNTTLYLQIDLDSKLWQLSESDFYPKGKTYFETSISFLENDKDFSMYSSGKRDDPIFNSQNYMVSTVQTFVFPKTPLPNSKFTVKAKVSLHNLPPTYSPPVAMDFLEPGIIEIPMWYVILATIGKCP
jgi:hypothetical protein